MFKRILIANRGEIAVRIIRACREMGIRTVAVYSQADRNAVHVGLADEAVCIGKAEASDSYLNMERIISAAIAVGAEAIHPGFGFLSENAEFVQMCEQHHITFIGPFSELISRMGNKSEAKKTMKQAGVPVVPGTEEAVYDLEEAKREAERIGYPVMIKASSGGGGKGMRIAKDRKVSFRAAQQESIRAFADDSMYLERYVQNPRHVEVQIMADKYGRVIQLGERDCSIQRRHQKMIEESPSPALTDEIRKKIRATAVQAAKAVNYESAGTIEFLLDDSGEFFFMEMNTRIQVEHPVSELISGVDLIREQILVAAGEALSVAQEDILFRGHAIECRINAEDPIRGFFPSPGTITHLHLPGGNGVRIDTAIYEGYQIPPNYDSMLVKVITYDRDRKTAIRKMIRALDEMKIEGVRTNLEFQYDILHQKDFREGNFTTDFISTHYEL